MPKQKPCYKIGFVLDGGLDKPDGVQQYVLALGDYFKGLGHQVRYIISGSNGMRVDGAKSLSGNLSVNSNGNRLSIPLPANVSRIKKYLAEEKFDVLHIQVPYSPMMGEQVIFHADKETAIIGTYHIVPYSWVLSLGNWILGKWCHFSLRKFDRMLSTSVAAQAVAKRDFNIDSDVSPNVVDYERFQKAKPFSKYDDGKINILFFGRLVPRKGCLVLLKAVRELLRSSGYDVPEFRVIVCGTGQLEDELKRYVLDNELGGYVEFVGYVEEADKPRYYASSDIAVFPSSGGESFGIVLIEALASGWSVVLGGDNSGYRSVLGEKEELLFDPLDHKLLAEKLYAYMNDKPKRIELGIWGKEFVRQFDVKTVGDSLLNIYGEALHNKQLQ